MTETLTAIGLASAESLEGLTVALLRTDGERIAEREASRFFPYGREMKVWLRRAIKAAVEGRERADDISKAAAETTAFHARAVRTFLEETNAEVDIVGFPGHTLLHRPARAPGSVGRSWQIGSGAVLAEELGIDVVDGFRAADMAAGGEGAPLAPAYLRARVLELSRKHAAGVVVLGDVVQLTFVPADAQDTDILAFDCGPGAALLRVFADRHGAAVGLEPAQAGVVHEDALRLMLLNSYLRRAGPKSLAPHDFKLDLLDNLSLEDGAATLTALMAGCVEASTRLLPEPCGEWILCGAGRKDHALVAASKAALSAPVLLAEDVGWEGDVLDAETAAYLAVRSARNLPLTFPKTTGVVRPMPGGAIHKARLQ